MKRNEFGEIENPRNKVNVFILIVAIVAVIVTGVVYAIKLNSQAQDLNAKYETSMEYCQK
jgi:Ni,Fe-hydrogenase I cytochrome b subunit